MPKPREAAEVLIKTLVKAHDNPTIKDVRLNGMPLNLLARDAGFAQMTTGQELSPALVRDGVYPSLGDFSAAIKEAQLRGWVGLEADEAVHVRVCPAGLDYGRLLLRPWREKVLSYLVSVPLQAVLIAAITALVTTVVTNLVLKAFGWP